MKHIYKIFKFTTSIAVLMLATACGSSGSAVIDDLFGSASPILTSVPDQTVSQEDLLHIDINNIKNGVPGDDRDGVQMLLPGIQFSKKILWGLTYMHLSNFFHWIKDTSHVQSMQKQIDPSREPFWFWEPYP